MSFPVVPVVLIDGVPCRIVSHSHTTLTWSWDDIHGGVSFIMRHPLPRPWKANKRRYGR